MKERLKKLIGVPLILIILVFVLAYGITSGELEAARGALQTIKKGCIFGCLLLFAAYILMDAVGIHSALKRQGYRLPFWETLMVSVRGQYYYYITPSASGGQPMQVYYLRQLGIPTGVGTSVLVCHFVAFQGMLAVLMTIFAISHGRYILDNISPHFVLLAVGYLVNLTITVALLFFSFSRKLVGKIIHAIIRVLVKLRLCRHPQAQELRVLATAKIFHDSMDWMFQHPPEVFRQLFYGGIQQLLLMSVIYVIYCGFGGGTASIWQVIAMALAQYTSAGYVPIPGASGAQEGVFSLFFRQIFPGGSCFAAMIIWRCTTFYLPLTLSAVSIVLYHRHSVQVAKKTFEDE